MIQITEPASCPLFQPRRKAEYGLRGRQVLEQVKARSANYPDSTGWMSVAARCTDDWLRPIEERAAFIRQQADVFVLVGVGGSNNAARAVIEALPSPVTGTSSMRATPCPDGL